MVTAGPQSSVLQRVDVGGLVFSQTVFQPHAVLGRHTHANAYISFAATGSYTERYEGSVRECDPSIVLFHPAGETHENLFHSRRVHLLRVEAANRDFPGQTGGLVSSTALATQQSAFLCRRMIAELRGSDELSGMVLQGLALELVAGIIRARRQEKEGPPWLRQLDELLQDACPAPIRLTDLATAIGVHPVHLSRTFSKYRGCTIGERIRELRVGRATQMLANTRLSIGEIANECGFADQSHLTRSMRRLLGVSPTVYRAQC